MTTNEETQNLDGGGESGYQRLEEQIAWYDSKSQSAQKWHKRTKVTELVLAALVAPAAYLHPLVASILGAGIVILEGLQHLNQWQRLWISYRSTCEDLRHEKYSFLGKFGAYTNLDEEDALRLLGERTESLVSTEHAKWIDNQKSCESNDDGQ